jgi:hypothetical protein
MSIGELSDLLDIQIEMTRYPNQSNRWTAKFKSCETKDKKSDPVLTGTYGNGFSPSEALSDYAYAIRGKVLIIDSYTERRREFVVPEKITV